MADSWLSTLRRDLALGWLGGADPGALVAEVAVLSCGIPLGFERELDRASRLGEVTLGTLHGRAVASAHLPAGTFAVEAALSTLALAGVPRAFFFGAAGALDPALEYGDTGVVESAAGDDGLSARYGAASPDPECQEALRAAQPAGKYVLHRLRVHTTGSILAEEAAEIRRLSGQGFQAIDCEAAGVLSLAARLGVAAGMVLLITDSPIRGLGLPKSLRERYLAERGKLRLSKLLAAAAGAVAKV